MKKNQSPLNTALFYGFTPRGHIKEDSKDKKRAASLSSKDPFWEERIPLIRNYIEKTFAPMQQPVSIYHSRKKNMLSLDILGSSKSISDAITIEATFAILSDEYKKENLLLEINSIGDKDSFAKFVRELGNFYYKKNWDKVPKAIKPLIKKNILETCKEKIPGIEKLQDMAPKSIGYLSENSRRHFKEVLEYIEALEIPYMINHSLLGLPLVGSETVIRISEMGKKGAIKKILASGGRYNQMARKIFGKKEIPSFGMNILLPKNIKPAVKINYKIFFIQLSFEAKCKSLKILENLRKANIPVFQSLGKDKLASQILQAEKMKVPFVIIMGKKEAIEGSVVVRAIETRCQETLAIKDLVPHLKKLL